MKERTRDEMLKQLDLLKEEAVHAATERTRLAMEVKDVSHDARREADALNRKVREYNQALRRCKKVELALNNSLSQHPFLQRQLAALEWKLKGQKTSEKMWWNQI